VVKHDVKLQSLSFQCERTIGVIPLSIYIQDKLYTYPRYRLLIDNFMFSRQDSGLATAFQMPQIFAQGGLAAEKTTFGY